MATEEAVYIVELDDQEEQALAVEADMDEDALLVEADEDNALVVELNDDEEVPEASVTTTAELWQSPDDFMKYARHTYSSMSVDKQSPNSLRAALASLFTLQRQIVRTAMGDDAYADFTTEQLHELDKLETNIESSSAVMQQLLEDAEAERSEVILQRLESKGLIKRAFKSAQVSLYADPFTYGIVRLCINAKVANGKNIEEVFEQLADHFKLEDRERLAIAMLLRDSGYPIRGSLIGDIDQIRQYFG